MISCPSCKSSNSHVIDVREISSVKNKTNYIGGTFGARRRRRTCDDCESRYTTYEIDSDEYEFLMELASQMRGVFDFIEKIKRPDQPIDDLSAILGQGVDE